jgi:hypothetical protein
MDTTHPAFIWSVDLPSAQQRLNERLQDVFNQPEATPWLNRWITAHRAVITGIQVFGSTLARAHNRDSWKRGELDNDLHLWLGKSEFDHLSSSTSVFSKFLNAYFKELVHGSHQTIESDVARLFGVADRQPVWESRSSTHRTRLFVHPIPDTHDIIESVLTQLPIQQLRYYSNGSEVSLPQTSRDVEHSVQMIAISKALTWTSTLWSTTTLHAISAFIEHGCRWPSFYTDNTIEIIDRVVQMSTSVDAERFVSRLNSVVDECNTWMNFMGSKMLKGYRERRFERAVDNEVVRMFQSDQSGGQYKLTVRLWADGSVLANQLISERNHSIFGTLSSLVMPHRVGSSEEEGWLSGDILTVAPPRDTLSQQEIDQQDYEIAFRGIPQLLCNNIFDLESYESQEWLRSNNTDNIVILTPPTQGNRWGGKAQCYTRSRIQEDLTNPTTVFYRCVLNDNGVPTSEGRNVQYNHAVRISMDSYQVYVPVRDVQYLLRATEFKVFQLRPTNALWQKTESRHASLGLPGAYMSGNHCQAGTSIAIHRLRGVMVRPRTSYTRAVDDIQ